MQVRILGIRSLMRWRCLLCVYTPRWIVIAHCNIAWNRQYNGRKKRKGYGILRHFQQCFSYIVAISVLFEETGRPGENHRPTLSHNVAAMTPRHDRDSNSQHYNGQKNKNKRIIGVIRNWRQSHRTSFLCGNRNGHHNMELRTKGQTIG
jgi:hypothetical protein